jgi:deferrochelatase/peroxidase EfeB
MYEYTYGTTLASTVEETNCKNISHILEISMTRYQEGIFYKRKSSPSLNSLVQDDSLCNSTFAIVFLRVTTGSSSTEIKQSLEKLWKMYALLRNGNVSNLTVRVPPGKLSVLIGYGPKIFSLCGVKRDTPENFKNRQFLPPSKQKGHILDGCGIKYSDETQDNVGLTEDIIIQFISNTQLATYRAVAETLKHLSLDVNRNVLKFSRFYTGFKRDDARNWLGFHEEISNMSSAMERKSAIFIDPFNNDLRYKDYWTKGGTYLAFLRIEVNMIRWEKIDRLQQELIVGRDKERGLPLLGVDKKGRPVTQKLWRRRIMKRSYDRIFRSHPDYFRIPNVPRNVLKKLDINASMRILSQSHIGRTRHIDDMSSDKPSSRRIYRQGFDFIEPLYNNPDKPFRVGLNFISFQNDPSRLFFILTDPNWMGKSNFGGEPSESGVFDLLSVLAAGLFFVPPHEKPFPGVSIFS